MKILRLLLHRAVEAGIETDPVADIRKPCVEVDIRGSTDTCVVEGTCVVADIRPYEVAFHTEEDLLRILEVVEDIPVGCYRPLVEGIRSVAEGDNIRVVEDTPAVLVEVLLRLGRRLRPREIVLRRPPL